MARVATHPLAAHFHITVIFVSFRFILIESFHFVFILLRLMPYRMYKLTANAIATAIVTAIASIAQLKASQIHRTAVRLSHGSSKKAYEIHHTAGQDYET